MGAWKVSWGFRGAPRGIQAGSRPAACECRAWEKAGKVSWGVRGPPRGIQAGSRPAACECRAWGKSGKVCTQGSVVPSEVCARGRPSADRWRGYDRGARPSFVPEPRGSPGPWFSPANHIDGLCWAEPAHLPGHRPGPSLRTHGGGCRQSCCRWAVGRHRAPAPPHRGPESAARRDAGWEEPPDGLADVNFSNTQRHEGPAGTVETGIHHSEVVGAHPDCTPLHVNLQRTQTYRGRTKAEPEPEAAGVTEAVWPSEPQPKSQPRQEVPSSLECPGEHKSGGGEWSGLWLCII